MSFLGCQAHLRRRLFGLAIAIVTGLMLSACGAHSGSGTHLVTADAIGAPHGAISFCQSRPDICGIAEDVAESALAEIKNDTPQPDHTIATTAGRALESMRATGGAGSAINDDDLLDIAQHVNADINTRLTYRTDLENWGRDEAWLLPLSDNLSAYGDCEDFALEKRQRLIELGVPTERLALATGWSRATGYHAMLILRTDRGDFVLDNASRHVQPVNNTPYVWDRLQSGPNLLAWTRIEGFGTTNSSRMATAGALSSNSETSM